MSLLQYVKDIIYKAKGFDNVSIPQTYDSFGILMPEASSSVQGIRPFPLQRMSIYLLSSGIFMMVIYCQLQFFRHLTHFVMKRSFLSGTRTQLHSHEYLEFFYVLEGEYHQKILETEYIFHPGEFCLIDKVSASGNF